MALSLPSPRSIPFIYFLSLCSLHFTVMAEQTCGRSCAAPPSCGPQERTSPHHHHLTHQHQPAPDPPLSSAQLSSGGPRALTALTTPPHPPPPAPLCSTSSLEERIRRLANQSRHLPRVSLFICDPPFGTSWSLRLCHFVNVFCVFFWSTHWRSIICWAEWCLWTCSVSGQDKSKTISECWTITLCRSKEDSEMKWCFRYEA